MGPELTPGHPRKIERVSTDAIEGFDANRLVGVTELRVDIGLDLRLAEVRALRDLVDDWARITCATRLRLDLTWPFILPNARSPIANGHAEKLSAETAIWEVAEILRRIPLEVEVDIVRHRPT